MSGLENMSMGLAKTLEVPSEVMEGDFRRRVTYLKYQEDCFLTIVLNNGHVYEWDAVSDFKSERRDGLQ